MKALFCDIDKVPADVLKVLAIMYNKHPVGIDMYEYIQKVITDNPEYFPWEAKYNSIPKEVHQAFKDECYPASKGGIEIEYRSKGLIDQLEENAFASSVTVEDFKSFFALLEEKEQKRDQLADKEKKRVKKIWDKHYKPYSLEFKENT